MTANSLGLVIDKNTVINTPWLQIVNDIIFYGLGVNQLNDRGSFVSGAPYAVNDLVVYPGYQSPTSSLYICVASTGSASVVPPSDSTHWALFGISSIGSVIITRYINASAGVVNITLPALIGAINGIEYLYFKTDSSANAVTITPAGSDSYCGFSSPLSLVNQGASAHVKANTLLPNWMVL